MAATLSPLQNPSTSCETLSKLRTFPKRTLTNSLENSFQTTRYEMSKSTESDSRTTSSKSRFSELSSKETRKQPGLSSSIKQTEATKKKEPSSHSSSERTSSQSRDKLKSENEKNEGVNTPQSTSKLTCDKNDLFDESYTHVLDEENHFEIFETTDTSDGITRSPVKESSSQDGNENQEHLIENLTAQKESQDLSVNAHGRTKHGQTEHGQTETSQNSRNVQKTEADAITLQQDAIVADALSKSSPSSQSVFGYEALISHDFKEFSIAFDGKTQANTELDDNHLDLSVFSESSPLKKGFLQNLPQEFKAMSTEFAQSTSSPALFEENGSDNVNDSNLDSDLNSVSASSSSIESKESKQKSTNDPIQGSDALPNPQRINGAKEPHKNEQAAEQKNDLTIEKTSQDRFLDKNASDQDFSENAEQDNSGATPLSTKSTVQKAVSNSMQNSHFQSQITNFLQETNGEISGLDAGSDRSSLTGDRSSLSSLSDMSSSLRSASSQKLGQASSLPPSLSQSIQNQIGMAVKTNAMNSKTEIKVQLSPISLGRVIIKIDVNSDGQAFVVVASEHADTRDLLQQDSERLASLLSEGDLDVSQDNISYEDFPGNDHHESTDTDKSQPQSSLDDNSQTVSSTITLNTPEIRINADGTWAAVA